MPDEPRWDDIFRTEDDDGARAGSADAFPDAGQRPAAAPGPLTRRAQQAEEDARYRRPRGKDRGRERQPREASPRDVFEKPRRKRRWGWLVAMLVVLALVVGAGVAGWVMFEDRIRDVLGWEEPNDFEGTGNGRQVDVTITAGEIGSDVASTLHEAGVTKTYEAFYELLVGLEAEQGSPVDFTPGTYALEEEMSAQSALEALQDPSNRLVSTVAVREGVTVATIVELLAAGTGIAAEEFEAALDDPASYGIPDEAPNFEGYLFPATYEFDPGVDAAAIVQRMVDRMFRALDEAGVAPEDRHRVLTIASLIQREARIADDFYKVSRVIQNRLDEGWKLEFDSTAQYGYLDEHGSVWSSSEQLTDVNDYNTYVIEGLPIGPIAAPGELAIDAALNPVDGSWMFFATINLDTGETVFSTTLAEHEDAVDRLRAWCREHEC